MRIVFMGSPDFAVPTLDALVAAGHEVAAVYCQPPRPAGRGKGLRPTAVQSRAEALGLPVRSPASLKSAEEQAALGALKADIAVVAAYGLILPQPILDAPRLGCINVHASLLPRWRGAAPVQRAIMAGDVVTGVTIMQMKAGLDTGPMLIQREVMIDRKNAAQLTGEFGIIGARLVVEYLRDPAGYPPIPQPDEGVTYAAKIRKEEARIDWTRPAGEIVRQIQGLAPSPGAWFEVGSERIKLLEAQIEPASRHPRESGGPASLLAIDEKKRDSRFRGNDGLVLDDRLTIACGDGAIRPTLLQRAGRGPMATGELLRGFPIPAGTILQ